MEDLKLLVDLHLPNHRQGPGSEADTLRALSLAGLAGRSGLRVADLGCGTGASTLVLAQHLDAQITAVDLVPSFLRALNDRADRLGLGERVTTVEGSLDALPLEPGSMDLIWSEGAIYNIGFRRGVALWRRLLKPGGVLAVSELTWLSGQRPAELQAYWDGIYPEVDTAAGKLAALEAEGFSPIGYFPLPESSWLQGYYRPLQARFPAFVQQQGGGERARALVAAEEDEITLYERFKAYYSYGFYVARRVEG